MKRETFRREFQAGGRSYILYDIQRLQAEGLADIDRLPFSIRIIVENLLCKLDGRIVKKENLLAVARCQKRYPEPAEIPHHPAQVLMQDFISVPQCRS